MVVRLPMAGLALDGEGQPFRSKGCLLSTPVDECSLIYSIIFLMFSGFHFRMYLYRILGGPIETIAPT